MSLTLAEFTGRWRITRQIDDQRAARTGTLTGEALFTPDGDGLVYEETGTLDFPGQPPLQARQTYLWRGAGQAVAVCFADGRPFHQFGFDAPKATHWCDPDQYDVTYDFVHWPDWSARWVVLGPRKAYVMTTRYSR